MGPFPDPLPRLPDIMRCCISTSRRSRAVYSRTCHASSPRHSRGFVLLMVLMAIVVVGVALTATARRSLLASVAAIESQRALQRQWGLRSCQQTLLPAAAQLFEVSDRSVRRQRGKQSALPALMQDRVLLGGHAFDLILADEDAKANLNALYDQGGKRECEQAITRLSGVMESRTMRLLPSRISAEMVKRQQATSSASDTNDDGDAADRIAAIESTGAFHSWGDVFDLVQVHRIAGDDRHLAQMTRKITLHGVGRLNVFRASDETVLAVCTSVIPDGLARRVVDKIRETSLNQVDLILEQTVTNVNDRATLQKLLSNNSSSFSLWTEVTGLNTRQQRYAVQAPDEFGTIRTTEFSFE